MIATGKLKEMAEESVQNVSAIIKKFSDVDLSEKDIHIQFVQAGQQGVDGDSASITVATAVISALEDIPVDQSVAMTGSLSVRATSSRSAASPTRSRPPRKPAVRRSSSPKPTNRT